jgi:hypothetical protein
MNYCEEVLKHSTNKGLKIEKDELYHSDTYLGSEYDEGLKHWKYIKKYKNSKGKTVYVYATENKHTNINETSRKADIKADSARYYRERQHEFGKRTDEASTEKYYLNKKRAEKAEKYSKFYNETADSMMDANAISIKNAKKKVKKGLDFITGYFKYLAGH